MIQALGFLAGPLGWAMRFLYNLVQNYGWTIIIFTLLVRVIMFPLTLKQQKSQARMSALQPMMQEIQKKWANDKQRQSVELQKFQEENNVKMTAGCLPMIVNMVVLFGIIAVIQAPLTYMTDIPADQIQNATYIVASQSEDENFLSQTYTQQSIVIGEVYDKPSMFTQPTLVKDAEGNELTVQVEQQWIDEILNFKFEFIGMNLAAVPSMELNIYLILPILSILTMFGSQIITMRTSGQQQSQGTMWIMTIVMGIMFGWFAFTIPVGFSLYYTASNIVMTLQQLVLKKIYDPNKIKEEVLAEIEEKKKAKKVKKKVVIKESDGRVIEKEMNESELMKLRLARARELDAQRYAEDEEEQQKNQEAAEKARKIDEEKYQDNSFKKRRKSSESIEDVDFVEVEDEPEPHEEPAEEPVVEAETPAVTLDKKPAKPGRRKRARQSKEKQETSFVQEEMEAERKSEQKDNEEG